MQSSSRKINEPPSVIPLFGGSEPTSSKWVKIGAVVCSLAVAVVLIIGYRFLRARHLERVHSAQKTDSSTKVVAPPEVQIFEDEARLKGSEAIITGTIRNISENRLDDLSLEVELKRRAAQVTERRKIKVEPAVLDPGEEGRYSLSLQSSEWSGARVVSLSSAQRAETIAFKSSVGARRQAERLPQGNQKVVVGPRPRPKGEEFLNTPDNPIRIP